MDILWSLGLYNILHSNLITYIFSFLLLLFVLIWCRSGEIVVGQTDFSSPPDQLSCKVWETFLNSDILSFSESCIHPLTIVSTYLLHQGDSYSGLMLYFSKVSDKTAIKKSEVR